MNLVLEIRKSTDSKRETEKDTDNYFNFTTSIPNANTYVSGSQLVNKISIKYLLFVIDQGPSWLPTFDLYNSKTW